MGRALRYIAFGDSLTVGTGDPTREGFTARYRGMAEAALGRSVVLRNAGTNGATSGELLQYLRNEGDLRRGLATSDIVTITAGGNDLIRSAMPYLKSRDTGVLKRSLRTFGGNLRQIVRYTQLPVPAGKSPLVILVGLYNPISMLPEAEFWIKRFNQQMERLQSRTVRYVDVYSAFKGAESRLISDDLFHPNAEGYKRIAECIAQSVPLTSLAGGGGH
ncbi:lipase [Paenibacillus chitinolyticus]|uniref:Lipase n=1 Tax=Paenibacillus chitinolyticus TaxID=79263 RepID=A0A410WZT6_9BACL|nr:GDSL-type esterase/lipase family protein [Paenibacillus chitinolyticus]MCY9592838.1 GDSL-type esterase/lipase family protein [Paenibacillus chitinolyticus]MCY9595969.1 GDSL-type esterase/lipase family protein [Paenibacillus chitinolyticus]QAV19965.1 lipase [Paenibacillus chitinolyticus]